MPLRKGCAGCVGCFALLLTLALATIVLSWFGIWGPRQALGQTLLEGYDRVSGCQESIITRSQSPSHDFIAEVSTVECGGFLGDAVINAGLLRATDEHTGTNLLAATYRGWGTSAVTVQWVDRATLRVRFQGDTDLIYHRARTQWEGIHIEYEFVPPGS